MEEFYNKNYKKFMLIPLVLFLAAIFIIFSHYQNTGDIVSKDVSLKGGLSIEIFTGKQVDENLVKEELKNRFPGGDFFATKLVEFNTNEQNGIVIESSDVQEEELKKAIENIIKIELKDGENYFVKETSSTLGKSFYRQMLFTIALAFILMGITVSIVYRKLIPSAAIIMAPMLNMVTTIAVVDLLGFRVSTASISALLLMLGYSIDTDVLLTTKVLKRKEGRVFERIKSSFITGITITLTTLTASIFAILITNSIIIREMFIILVIGLITDLISTYIMNAGILRWYLKNED